MCCVNFLFFISAKRARAGSFSCSCVIGWEGHDCSENVDDCLHNTCFLGATCVDGIGKYECKCMEGKAGQ